VSVEDYALIGGIVGGLAGAFVFLVKMLIVAKDDRIGDMVDERDYYRDAAIAGGTQLPDHEAWYLRRHPPEYR